MQEMLKLWGPWAILLLWLLWTRFPGSRGASAASFYLTVFAGFASNFSSHYREIGQAVVALAAVYTLLVVYQTRQVLRINGIFAVLAGFALVSLLGNPISELAVGATVNLLSIILAVNFLFLRLKGREELHAFIAYYVLLSALLAMFAMAEWISTGGRVEVTFANSNYLGFFLGLASCAALSFPRIRWRWVTWAVISIGIYCTGSRAALAFPVLAVAAYCYSGGVRRIVRMAPFVLLLALGVLFTPLPTTVAGRTSLEGSDNERLVAIEVGVEMVRNNPVVGVGWGRFQEDFRKYVGSSRPMFAATATTNLSTQRDMVSHNDVVRVFAEMGVLAGLWFCGLILYAGYCSLRFCGEYRAFCCATLFGMFIFSLTHNNLNSSLFWFFFLLPIALYYRSMRAAKFATGRDA